MIPNRRASSCRRRRSPRRVDCPHEGGARAYVGEYGLAVPQEVNVAIALGRQIFIRTQDETLSVAIRVNVFPTTRYFSAIGVGPFSP